MPTTSEMVLRELFVPMWRGLAEVEKRVTERVLFDEVLPQLDLDDPPEKLRPTAAVFRAIEDELRPGGIRAWPGRELEPKRRRELAIIVFLDLLGQELSRIAARWRARLVVAQVLRSVESMCLRPLLPGTDGRRSPPLGTPAALSA